MIGFLVGAAIVVAVISAVFLDSTGDNGSGLSRDYTYDIEELAKIDPALILYSESGTSVETGFEKSKAITVDSQKNVYVAGDKAIRVFDSNAALVRTIELGAEARSLAVSAEGAVYTGVGDHIEVYDRNSKRIASWKSLGDSAVITSIALSKQGDVFVADAGNRIIIRYDSAGNEINRIGQKDAGKNVPGFLIPSPYFDLAIPRDGMLRAVNPGLGQIDAYTFDGDYEFSWGKQSVKVEGFCGCCNPINIAMLGDDSFVTCEKGINRIKVYDRDGNFKGVVAGPDELTPDTPQKICVFPEQCQSGGFDVATDQDSAVYVLDTIKNTVRIFRLKEI